MDADIELGITAVREVAEVLRGGPILAAAPRLEVDLDGASWPIRAHYDIWMRLPYVQDRLLGCGVYALSTEGRARFDEFPSIIADDYFVHTLFEPHERDSVTAVSFLMRPPRTLRALIGVNVRRRVGVFELLEGHDHARDRIGRGRRQQRRALAMLVLRPWLWLSLAVYSLSKLATVTIHWLKIARGREKEWARDDSSRLSS